MVADAWLLASKAICFGFNDKFRKKSSNRRMQLIADSNTLYVASFLRKCFGAARLCMQAHLAYYSMHTSAVSFIIQQHVVVCSIDCATRVCAQAQQHKLHCMQARCSVLHERGARRRKSILKHASPVAWAKQVRQLSLGIVSPLLSAGRSGAQGAGSSFCPGVLDAGRWSAPP